MSVISWPLAPRSRVVILLVMPAATFALLATRPPSLMVFYNHHCGVMGFQEPVFVPRTADAPEGDGYLVLVRNRLAEMRSELVILDVASLEAPPLAVVPMPVRLRDAIHGSWVPA